MGRAYGDGSWWWHRTARLLPERGVSSVAPVLPSCGEADLPGGADGYGLPEDVASVRKALMGGGEPTVVVAHRYGGIVTAEVAAGVRSVKSSAAAASYLPEVGQSLSEFGDGARPRSSTSIPTPAPSGSTPSCWWTRSSRIATPSPRRRRQTTSLGRACR